MLGAAHTPSQSLPFQPNSDKPQQAGGAQLLRERVLLHISGLSTSQKSKGRGMQMGLGSLED